MYSRKSVTNSLHQDHGLWYLHLPIFSYTYFPVLLQNKNFLGRSLQIVCTVTTMNVLCMQVTLRVHENVSTVLIPLC